MDFWPAFSDELSKVAGAVKFHNKELKREFENRKYENRHTRHFGVPMNAKLNEGAGTGQTFRTPEEVEKYRAGVREHLRKPEVAARVATRRNRGVSKGNTGKVKTKGKLGFIAKALSVLAASGGIGYLLGHKKKGNVNEPVRTPTS